MYHKSYILAFFCILTCFSQTPPVFPDQYEMSFNESASIGPLKGNTTGKMYVDAKNNK